MGKNKGPRINIIIECTQCRENFVKKGVSRYLTSKNRRNTNTKLEINKFCKYCKKHTLHKESK
jgi:large subunit ribosomal protein L33